MEESLFMSRIAWLRRHWKIALLVWLGFSLSGVLVAIIWVGNSYVTKLSVAAAESNPAVLERLGSPLKKGWFVSGSISVQSGYGQAELTIPVSGPKGHGSIYVEAAKEAGIWHLSKLQLVQADHSNRLDLLAGSSSKSTTSTQ